MMGWQVILVATLVVSSEAWVRSAPPWAKSKYNTGKSIGHDADDGRDESFPAADHLIAPPPGSAQRQTYFEPDPSYSLSYVTGNNVDMEEKLPHYQAFKSSPSLSFDTGMDVQMEEKLPEYQTFETVTQPSVQASWMQSMDPSYSFKYSMQDKMLAQQVDSNGRVSGAYSWIMPDGGTMAFSSSSGDHNMDPVPRPSHHGYNNNHLNNNKQKNFSDRNNLSVPTDGQQNQTNKRQKSHSLVASGPDVTGAGYMMRIQGEDSQWIENSDERGERSGYYSYNNPDGDTILVRYSAGRNGFRVLETKGIPGMAQFG